MSWRGPWMRSMRTTESSSRLTASGQNSCFGPVQARANLDSGTEVGTGFVYEGCDRIRTQPFCVIGHDVQPSSALLHEGSGPSMTGRPGGGYYKRRSDAIRSETSGASPK